MENTVINESNVYEDCPCQAKCHRHGKCVECITHHMSHPSMVSCMRQVAAKLDDEGKLEGIIAPYKKEK